MKNSENFLPPGSAATGASPHHYLCGTPGSGAVWAGQLKSAEALRRKAYLRLAKTVGISWLDCRKAATKTQSRLCAH